MLLKKKSSIEKILKIAKKKRIKELSDNLDNIVFLDYDGVINTDVNNYGEKPYNKVCVNNLNKLCLKYNLKIVVISSWRKYPNYTDILYKSGLDKRISILGCTNIIGGSREDEIKDYLLNSPYVDKFIILDDGKFFELEKYQIKTIFENGFDDEKYLEAEKFLTKP